MAANENGKPVSGLGRGMAMVPGSATGCVLITVLTVMLATFSGHPTIDPVLRTLYFAVLCAAFHTIKRREPSLDTTALRLVVLGFLVLTLGSAASAVIRLGYGGDPTEILELLCLSFERGAVFLLGVSLITYGILLSLPALVESYRVLRVDFAEVKHSHRHMENRVVEADRYRALGELAAGVAHDMRNPLTIVKTAAESLSKKARSAEEIAEHSRVITRNIEKAERTIAALLDLGKPRECAPQSLDLVDLVAEFATLVKPEARRRRVEVVHERGETLRVETDPKLLGQALLNLILNALQASPEGADVSLRTRVFRFGEEQLAAILVEDHGAGIQTTDRDRLFSPFFTTKDGGTGLGLLSCRRILDDLGGDIGLFPRHGGGARAIILLPMQPQGALV